MANNNHFNLTLDTIAPTGSITRPSEYVKAANITFAVASTASDVKYMKCWLTRAGMTDAEKTSAKSAASWVAYSTSAILTASAEGEWYGNVIFMDDIGNESSEYTSSKVTYDKTAPTIASVVVSDPSPVDGQPDDETDSLINSIVITASDNVTDKTGVASNISAFHISCDAFASDYTVSPSSGNSYTGEIEFKSGTTQGSYTVSVYAVDKAGNTSATKTFTIYYDDSTEKDITLNVYKDSKYATLATYTNSATSYAKITFYTESGETSPHIVGYKLWRQGTTEPATWTTVTKGSASVSAGAITGYSEGTVQYNAKSIDDVGHECTKTATYSFTYDITAPAAALSIDKTRISGASGTKPTATVSYTLSDTNISSWTLAVNGTSIASGSSNVTSAATKSITASTSGMKENATNSITLTVTDKASNTTTKTVSLYLDTKAPTATWTTPTGVWYNKVGGTDPNSGTAWSDPIISVSGDGSSGESITCYYWTSDTATDTTCTSSTGATVVSGSNTVSTRSIVGMNGSYPNEKGTIQYVHAKVVDDVGNVSYAHAAYQYDETAPGTPTVTFTAAAYNSTTAALTITPGTESASGITQFKVTGDITTSGEWIEWKAANGTNYSVTLTSGDGCKKVTVILRDLAGNASASSATADTELDTSTPTGSLTLRNKGTAADKDNPSNIKDVDLFINFADATILDHHGTNYYKIWGDINGGAATEAEASWVAFDSTTSTSKTISVVCTTGDGVKTFYAKVKDNAGNESAVWSDSFTLDTEAANVYAQVDYNKISKTHTVRWSAVNTEIDGKYNDIVNVTVKLVTEAGGTTASNEKYIAYKAVAYKDAAAAKAGSAADTAIDGTSWSGTATSAVISMTITGANFEKALNGGTAVTDHSMDGAHVVTVYVQDEAGTWSEAATF